jgi:hypothetical protein
MSKAVLQLMAKPWLLGIRARSIAASELRD